MRASPSVHDGVETPSAISLKQSSTIAEIRNKWYTTNATDPRCKIAIFMGKTDAANPDRHKQQSMILVPLDTAGVKVVRAIGVFGFYGVPDRASEVTFTNARVPASYMLLGEGRGFEIAQGRLGSRRIHHCMRLIGLAERMLELMCKRSLTSPSKA